MAEPNPKRHSDSEHGLLPKVFIVYPHNPQVYRWSPPTPLEQLRQRYPGSDQYLKQIQMDELKSREKEEKERILRHDKLVYNFAQFLESHKIAVSYEGLLLDTPTANYMRWFQEQMKDSDYILLIITESFCHFLSNEPPGGKERIFECEFLHIFVNSPRKTILPIFLDRPENFDLLPDALRASTTYHVSCIREYPYFDVQQPQLSNLYAVLTKQNRIRPPPQVLKVPVVTGGLQRRGGSRSPVQAHLNSGFLSVDRHSKMYDSLVCIKRPLTPQAATSLSEKPGFAVHWRMLAESLGFTLAEIERLRDADHDDIERCVQLLFKWQQKEHVNATVSKLIEGVCNIQNLAMLEIAYSVIHNHY